MATRDGHLPAYRLHKPSGQARAIVHGNHSYLGKDETPSSRSGNATIETPTGERSITVCGRQRRPVSCCPIGIRASCGIIEVRTSAGSTVVPVG
jgi:hypothetical protein